MGMLGARGVWGAIDWEKVQWALWGARNVLGGGYTSKHVLKFSYVGKNALSWLLMVCPFYCRKKCLKN